MNRAHRRDDSGVTNLTLVIANQTISVLRERSGADGVSVRDHRLELAADCGFTLIELLVVILVVGVLAAIAIPTLLVSRAEAGDAPAKELVHTAQTATETAALDASGSYAGITPTLLRQQEPTISTTKKNAAAYVSALTTTATTYALTVTSVLTGNKFTLTRNANGTFARACTIPSKTSTPGGCDNVSGKKGTW